MSSMKHKYLIFYWLLGSNRAVANSYYFGDPLKLFITNWMEQLAIKFEIADLCYTIVLISTSSIFTWCVKLEGPFAGIDSYSNRSNCWKCIQQGCFISWLDIDESWNCGTRIGSLIHASFRLKKKLFTFINFYLQFLLVFSNEDLNINDD